MGKILAVVSNLNKDLQSLAQFKRPHLSKSRVHKMYSTLNLYSPPNSKIQFQATSLLEPAKKQNKQTNK